MTTDSWHDLHDATLESLELRWSSGEAVMRIRTGTTHPQGVIVASAVRRVSCDRLMPWGPSVSINKVSGPSSAGVDGSVLEIEMQSGDVIRIEAGGFRLLEAG